VEEAVNDLHKLIDLSKDIIRESLEKFGKKLAIAWTGGKDSTSMLWLYREVCRELSVPLPTCMFIDEGDSFEEILDFIDKVRRQWEVEVVTIQNTDVIKKVKKLGDIIQVRDLNAGNQEEVVKLDFSEESFPFEPESYVCNHLMKTVPMNNFIEENGMQAISTAIRWDEQEARIKEEYFSYRENPVHTRVHPVLHFSERDIWNLIREQDIPFCSLYYLGYRSLGIKSNTTKSSDLPAWEQDLENTPERAGRGQEKEQIMAKLRDLGYM
jgi:phosphoadenosine phosphosulfate reductase